MLKQITFRLLLGLILATSILANSPVQPAPQANDSFLSILQIQESDFDLGFKAFNKGDYDAAVYYYTRHIGKVPSDHSAYYNRGLAYTFLKKYQQGIADFNKVLEMNPQYWKAYAGLGYANLLLQNYEVAIRHLTSSIQLNPNDSVSYDNRGVCYKALGREDLAQADFDKATQIKSGNTQSSVPTSTPTPTGTEEDLKAGIKAIDDKDYASAVTYFTRYINAFPSKRAGYYNRGLAYDYLNKFDEAIADYSRAIQIDPNFTEAYFGRGYVYGASQKYELAIADYTTYIKLDPKNKSAYKNRAIMYRKIGRTDLADADSAVVAQLEKGGNPTPSNTPVPTNTPATTTAKTINDLTPQQILEVGLYAFKNENYEATVSLMSKYLQSFPNEKVAYYIRGLANVRLKNIDYAIADYDRSLQIDPNYTEVYSSRGYLYTVKRNYDLAIKDFNKAIKLDPNFEQAYINRGIAFKEMGKTKNAEEDFAKADSIYFAKTDAKIAQMVPLQPNSKGISWTPVVEMDKQIFPSYFLARATIPVEEKRDGFVLGDNHGIIGFHLVNPKPNSKITIGVQLDPILGYQEFQYNLAVKDKRYRIFPNIVWNWDALKRYKKPSPANATFTLSINGELIEKKTVVVRIRSINEAVFQYRFLDNENWADTGSMFAAYVNEDHEWIDPLLKEVLETRRIEAFSGYQGGPKGVAEQVFAIWYLFQRRGFKYSSITDTSGTKNLVYSQYVRFFDESIKVAQANCVDGSVLFASILRKIGISVYLVLTPNHCFLVFDMDGKGDLWGLETTAIGMVDLRDYAEKDRVNVSYDVFKKALSAGNKQLQEVVAKINAKQPGYSLISISKARKDGINPVDWEAK